ASAPTPPPAPQKRVAVVGAGIVGASIAYHLAQHAQRVTIFEQAHPACAASGNSAGFLAKDWSDTSALKHLAHISYDMHRAYATSLQHPIHYRPLHSYSVALTDCTSPRLRSTASRPPALAWLDGRATVLNGARQIGSPRTTAQVLPSALVTALLAHAQSAVGSRLVLSRVTRIEPLVSSASVSSTCVSSTSASPAPPRWTVTTQQNGHHAYVFDVVILAMGPWTQTARAWFPQLPHVSAHKAASLVIPIRNLPPTALFAEFITPNRPTRTIDAYPRSDELYLCQTAIPEQLPEHPSSARPDPRDIESLRHFANVLNKDLALAASNRSTHRARACWLPLSADGLPLIGPVGGTHNSVFVATAHACWGILNSAATAKAIAELVTYGRAISIDIRPFDPSRFSSRPSNDSVP
ncbi:unnamed protein product, partial [Agarophyton chilense]